MIGGYDNDYTSTLDCKQVINNFLELIAKKWPSAILNITDDLENKEFFATVSDLPLSINISEGTVYICRDKRMKELADHVGLEGIEESEGPIMLFFWQRLEKCDLDLVTHDLPEENEFCAWAVEQLSIASSKLK